jgi:signal transduction histidine kinase
MHREATPAFKARPQIDRILEKFGAFARDRDLQCANEMAEDATVAGVPVAAYSGILLNLYTNALKAVLAKEGGSKPAQVVFRGWNEPGKHTVEVLDKGIGIPPELQSRIFDPLFTTTSTISNPLGSGMGLGLSLVSEVVKHSGGKLTIVTPPADFSTCFRVQFKVAQ